MSARISSIDLPGVTGEYFTAANAFDVDRTSALFAENAEVMDEGKRLVGREAIREWIERTMREFAATASPEHVDIRGASVVVIALVSGRFPGSPARLTFHFTVAGDQIAALEIQ